METARQDSRAAAEAEPDLGLITEIAVLYYLEEVTQEDLAKRFGMSRARVGRLLRRARELGVVDIRVQAPRSVQADVETELNRRFGLDRVLLALDQSDEDAQRAAVAGLVADHLNRTLANDMIIAVGMGRNVGAVADNSFSPDRRRVVFVSAIGGSSRAGEYMNSDHISRRLAARFGGESETLYAPALVSEPQLRAALIANDTVRQTLDRARRADIALIGVGDVSENSNMVRMGWFSQQEIVEARLSGTVGDMMGYDFIDIDGKPSHVAMQNRVIGLSTADLRRIPDVVAIASESSKAAGILGALRTGTINTLATSVSNARLVLQLDDSTRGARG
ncbi:MAG TPA: sugar-binding transcriptional regulator [Devosia sp.]|jgi:DNA-binding transcriptional regulator LsrR (DeoR family)|nr:sugar-binding transcriptional regulator [Devosia sp.]